MCMILLLDDDDDFRVALAANLADDGYDVRQFARPADIPTLTSLEPIAVLILDYQMEGEDGLSFADRFHIAQPNVPIVILTAYWSGHLDSEIARRTFISLRRKPIDYDDLLKLIPLNRGGDSKRL
ncbi:MAG: response regulator [Candidatus Binatia bacterium]